MTEQQRQADWAAVHSPGTSTEELTRIARDHPEFMPAVMAHENAPGATSRFSSNADPAQAHAQASSYAQPGTALAGGRSPGGTNVLAIVALVVAAVGSLSGLVFPVIVQSMLSSGATGAIPVVTGMINWVFILATGIIALLALFKKDQTRCRWAAYAALGVAGSSVLGFFASIFGGLFASLVFY